MTKIYEKENINTEKFALLNILKALESLSTASGKDGKPVTEEKEETPQPARTAESNKKTTAQNAEQNAEQNGKILSVSYAGEFLERHERIANKVHRDCK